MTEEQKALGTIGLALRSGNVVSGEFLTEKSIREHKAKLVIVAGDASDNTKKKFRNACKYHRVPLSFFSDKGTLGSALGKENRASLAILDEGFAKSITKNSILCMEEFEYGKNENI